MAPSPPSRSPFPSGSGSGVAVPAIDGNDAGDPPLPPWLFPERPAGPPPTEQEPAGFSGRGREGAGGVSGGAAAHGSRSLATIDRGGGVGGGRGGTERGRMPLASLRPSSPALPHPAPPPPAPSHGTVGASRPWSSQVRGSRPPSRLGGGSAAAAMVAELRPSVNGVGVGGGARPPSAPQPHQPPQQPAAAATEAAATAAAATAPPPPTMSIIRGTGKHAALVRTVRARAAAAQAVLCESPGPRGSAADAASGPGPGQGAAGRERPPS